MAERERKKTLSEKRCTKCGEIKLLSEFYKENRKGRSVDGHCSACRWCGGFKGLQHIRMSDEEKRKRRREYVKRNPKKAEWRKRSRKRNLERYRFDSQFRNAVKEKNKIYWVRARREINDRYVRFYLTKQFGLKRAEITPELVEMRRDQMIANKLLSQIRKEINP